MIFGGGPELQSKGAPSLFSFLFLGKFYLLKFFFFFGPRQPPPGSIPRCHPNKTFLPEKLEREL